MGGKELSGFQYLPTAKGRDWSSSSPKSEGLSKYPGLFTESPEKPCQDNKDKMETYQSQKEKENTKINL